LPSSPATSPRLRILAGIAIVIALAAAYWLLYVALLGLSLWLLYRSARSHGALAPVYLGAGGAIAALAGLWISPLVVYAGLGIIVAASLWDFRNLRRSAACARS
jgi:mercuric ion transport protein